MKSGPGLARVPAHLYVDVMISRSSKRNRDVGRPGKAGLVSRAEAALVAGELETALGLYKRAVRAEPGNFSAWANYGTILMHLEKTAEAAEALARAHTLEPGSVDVTVNLAALANQTGDGTRAEALYRHALTLAPDDTETWYNFAQAKRFKPDDPDIAGVERIYRSAAGEGARLVYAAFALGKAYEDAGRHDEAFRCYEEANRLKWRNVNFDLAAERRFATHLAEMFSQRFFAERMGGGADSQVPVFILGMPRSGTTLVEQIVSSHGDVFGAGEIRDLRPLVGRMFPRFPDEVAACAPARWREFGEAYVTGLRKRAPKASRITNKNLWNFYLCGVIALALPNARIIHCKRSAMDTCVSCYSLHFAEGYEFTYDQQMLGAYYGVYRSIMDHWQRVLPGRILDVEYEHLVSDPEPQARRLIEFCGLEWQDQCLEFHRSKRQVATASAAQVREPVHTRSVARWRRFENHLGPLRQALGAYADEADAG